MRHAKSYIDFTDKVITCVYVCVREIVRVCVCACVCEGERERDRDRETERERMLVYCIYLS